MKNRLNKKIKKLCRQIEKDYEAPVVRGKASVGKEAVTIPVSIQENKEGEEISLYNRPIGLIEIKRNKLNFIPTVKKKSTTRNIIKIIIFIISILGVKSIIQPKKKWESD